MTSKVTAATSVKMSSPSLSAHDREDSCHHTEFPCEKGKKDQLSLKRLLPKRCLYPACFGFGVSRKQFLRVRATGGSIASSMSVPGTGIRSVDKIPSHGPHGNKFNYFHVCYFTSSKLPVLLILSSKSIS